tara:strand:- start:334 stop:1227 length:894 start_codon:yes stop_codon:yes gene_type:complete
MVRLKNIPYGLIISIIVAIILYNCSNKKSINNIIDNKTVNKKELNIWCYWEPQPPPEIVLKCYENWVNVSKLENIYYLNENNITEYIPRSDLDKINKYSDGNLAIKSDFIGLYLLNKYSGVWLDSSIYFSKPLKEWLPTGKFFAFEAGRFNSYTKSMETFLMYSPSPNNPIPLKWFKTMVYVSENFKNKKDFFDHAENKYPGIVGGLHEYLWVYLAGKYLLAENPELVNELNTLKAEDIPWYDTEQSGWDAEITCSRLKKKTEESKAPCSRCYVTKLYSALRDCDPSIIPLELFNDI